MLQTDHDLPADPRGGVRRHADQLHFAVGSRKRQLADVGRHAGSQHGLEHEGAADDLGPQVEEERQVGRRAGLPDLRQPGRLGRHRARRHEQRSDARSERQGGQRHPDGVPRVGRPVPVAGRPRQARGRPRQRLAVPGHLLVAAHRGRHRVLHVQPRRADGGRPRRLPRRLERRPREGREERARDRRRRHLALRHDGRARRDAAQHGERLAGQPWRF